MKKLTFFVLLVFLVTSCAPSKRPKMLPTKEKFLSLVRYIIINEEKDMYREYPSSQREEFIEQFWARRDSRPETVRNEFKEEFYQRINEANKLFFGGKAGWLQDRGMVYILFGPPDRKQTHLTRRYKILMEIWTYYRIHRFVFPRGVHICFIDRYGTADYRITSDVNIPDPKNPYNPFGANMLSLATINDLAERIKHELLLISPIFNFKCRFSKQGEKKENKQCLIHLEMPYDRIIFNQENDYLVADIELKVEIRDRNQIVKWDFNEMYNLNFDFDKFESIKKNLWILDIQLPDTLPKGKHSVYITMSNVFMGQIVRKEIELKI